MALNDAYISKRHTRQLHQTIFKQLSTKLNRLKQQPQRQQQQSKRPPKGRGKQTKKTASAHHRHPDLGLILPRGINRTTRNQTKEERIPLPSLASQSHPGTTPPLQARGESVSHKVGGRLLIWSFLAKYHHRPVSPQCCSKRLCSGLWRSRAPSPLQVSSVFRSAKEPANRGGSSTGIWETLGQGCDRTGQRPYIARLLQPTFHGRHERQRVQACDQPVDTQHLPQGYNFLVLFLAMLSG